ncbi:MAG: iron-containing alcohol dehydrogenase [Actinobacteria bacterium]|nr:iron-containing alcohol dehydrogenase [Actinomycetota bacterium]
MTAPVRPFVGPARALAGAGASASVGSELRAAGVRPDDGVVPLVADAAVLKLGLADAAIDSLSAAGFTLDVRPGVEAEPTPDTIRGLIGDQADAPIAAVASIGGGSALDAAKLVSLAHANEIDLTAGVKATEEVEPGPPILAVPTTAGTGAEATAVAMLWHGGAKRMFVHGHLVPRVVVLDPDLLADLPPAVTGSSGLDAISHAVESLLSTFRTPLSETAAKAALGLLAGAVPEAYASGSPQSRHDTLLGAFDAGLALNASVVLGHSLAYVIAGRAGLPHGVSCAMALPYCLAHARPAREAEIDEIAGIVCGKEEGLALLDWLLAANESMGIAPSLAAVGIDADEVESMAVECAERYPRPNHPVPITVEGLEELLSAFHAGDALATWVSAGARA